MKARLGRDAKDTVLIKYYVCGMIFFVLDFKFDYICIETSCSDMCPSMFQNRGVYMFRIDCDIVIDATMAGGPARYINHSCAPNCVAEVVPFEKESKIIIITSRRLAKGEEVRGTC